MAQNPSTYKLSPQALKDRHLSMLFLTLFIVLNLPLVLYILTTGSGQSFDWHESWPVIAGILLFVAAECWLLSIVLLKNLAKTTLEWHHQFFVRINGYRREHYPLEAIQAVRFIEHPRRPERLVIKVYLGHRRLYLHGYEPMASLREHFEGLSVLQERRRQHIDWQHPFTLGIVLAAATPVIAFAAYQGELFLDLLYPMVLTILCLYLALYRPLSRAVSQRYARLELLVSALAGLLALASLLPLILPLLSTLF